jgi:hypothetical protein
MPRKMARAPGATAAAINTDAVTPAPEQTPSPAPAREKKIDKVIALLRREDGATLAEMIEATGWLAHTTRAALTGLRKKGHVLEKSKRDDATCYRIVEAG